MADTTWGVRVDEDTKQELTELLNASGEQGKDFVLSMLTAYKLKKTEELQPIATQDLKELQTHIKRIQDIYYNLTQRIETRLIEKDHELEDIISEKNLELELTKDMSEQLKIRLQEVSDELKTNKMVIKEQGERMDELSEINNTTKSLIQEYKEKNDMLTGLLSEHKGYKEEIEVVRSKLSQEQDARAEAEKSNNEMYKLVEEMKVKYKEEVQRNKDKLSIEYKTELLENQAKHQEEINAIHQSYNDKIGELNTKVHGLILSLKPNERKVRKISKENKGDAQEEAEVSNK